MSSEDSTNEDRPTQNDLAMLGEHPAIDAETYTTGVAEQAQHLIDSSPGSKLRLKSTFDPGDIGGVEADKNNPHGVKVKILLAGLGVLSVGALGYEVYRAARKMRPNKKS
jgi:hypothetical protein